VDVRDFMLRGGYYGDWFPLTYRVLVYVSKKPTASIIKVEECAKQNKINFVFTDFKIFSVMSMAKLKLNSMKLSPLRNHQLLSYSRISQHFM
jgi:hypothetical protein